MQASVVCAEPLPSPLRLQGKATLVCPQHHPNCVSACSEDFSHFSYFLRQSSQSTTSLKNHTGLDLATTLRTSLADILLFRSKASHTKVNGLIHIVDGVIGILHHWCLDLYTYLCSALGQGAALMTLQDSSNRSCLARTRARMSSKR